jgi:pyruvate dehydrogenase E2 component (dihydrolipoamide acetyltransferase)
MPTEIRMPRLIDSMTQGAVVAWRKGEGDSVQAGEAIAEIEADKTTVDLEAPAAGRLVKILTPAGSDKVEVGAVLAIVDEAGEAGAAVIKQPTPAPASAAIQPNGHPPSADEVEPEPHAVSAPTVIPRPADIPPGVDATPLARRMAVQAGLDLSSIRGSGPRGRIVRADVLAALGLESNVEDARPARAPASPATRPPSPASASFDEVPHSRVRRVIAERLGESKRTIPHFYLEAGCKIDALLQLREEIGASQDDGTKPSINDFALRAAALALKKVPEANASWTDAATRRYRRIDLAFAVATEGGLVAPVIRDADRKGLAELGEEVRDLAARAREGRLRPEELDGGTFTVSNLGMFGVDAIYAIVNPPQAAILGLGAGQPRPVAEEGSVVVATVMTCTLSADHRVLDGATGARFLVTFKGLIERPLNMIL